MNPAYSYHHQRGDEPATIDDRVLLDAAGVIARFVDLVSEADERPAFDPAPAVTLERLLSLRRPFERYLDPTAELTERETAAVRTTLARFDEVAARGPFDPGPDRDYALGVMALALGVSIAHPGPIPPSFPDAQPYGRPPPTRSTP